MNAVRSIYSGNLYLSYSEGADICIHCPNPELCHRLQYGLVY
uniref:Uncharacterized protein n=1 Tax=Arundo donax TaxID=35708 RepID=A0A0A8ZLT1_ARUDO